MRYTQSKNGQKDPKGVIGAFNMKRHRVRIYGPGNKDYISDEKAFSVNLVNLVSSKYDCPQILEE